MFQPVIPDLRSKSNAEIQSLVMQSEGLISDGRLRLLVKVLEYYATMPGPFGEEARNALVIAGVSSAWWNTFEVTAEMSRKLPPIDLAEEI